MHTAYDLGAMYLNAYSGYGDRYVHCTKPDCHKYHWGAYGAAGLLLIRRNTTTATMASVDVLLQLRGWDTQSSGTWALPGGALDLGETPAEGALREAHEEVSLPPGCTDGEDPLVVLRDEVVTTDHGNWRYTTVVAEMRGPWEPVIPVGGDDESLALEWVAVGDVDGRLLHPGFEASWPELRSRIEWRNDEHDAPDKKSAG